MKYKKITNSDITFFIKKLSKENVFCSEADLKKYSHDETEDLSFLPEIVLKPHSTKEISECLNIVTSKIFQLLHVALEQVLVADQFLYMEEWR